jgi:uncharacterized protein (DUF2236 family)
MSAGQDHGLFGPDSVTWRVHSSPVMLVGGMRALMIQTLHPLAMAGVVQHSDFRAKPLVRLRRTVEYVATVTFGDTAAAEAAGARVRNLHSRVRGTDRVTGREYSAEDPETLLWVHCVEVHSFLAAYRAFEGGLARADQDAYLAESARAAAQVGIPPETVPDSVEAMREYFAQMRPQLCASLEAQEAVRFVLSPPLTRELLALAVPLRVVSSAAASLLPDDLRRLAGIDRPRQVDQATGLAVSGAARAMALGLRVPLVGRAGVGAIRRRVAAAPFAQAA